MSPGIDFVFNASNCYHSSRTDPCLNQ